MGLVELCHYKHRVTFTVKLDFTVEQDCEGQTPVGSCDWLPGHFKYCHTILT